MVDLKFINDIKTKARDIFRGDETSMEYQIVEVIFDPEFIDNNLSFTNKTLGEIVAKKYNRKTLSVVSQVCKILQSQSWCAIFKHEKKILVDGKVPQWIHTYTDQFLDKYRPTLCEPTVAEVMAEIPDESITPIEPIIEESIDPIDPPVENQNSSIMDTLTPLEEVVDKPRLKAVMLGGFPQEFPRLIDVADKYGVDLKIYTKNIVNIGDPDMLILCTSRSSHTYQSILNKYKYSVEVKYLNTCNKRCFEKLLKEHFGIEDNPLPEVVEEHIIETPPCKRSEYDNAMTVETVVENTVEETSTQEISAPTEKPKECYIAYILEELERNMGESLMAAKRALEELDIRTGKFDVNYSNEKFAVKLAFGI